MAAVATLDSRSYMNYSTVLQFLFGLGKSTIHLDVCELTQDPKLLDAIVMNKSSASPSDVILGKLVSPHANLAIPVAIKVFAKGNPADPDDSGLMGLEYEAKIYRYIVDNIISQNFSPNFAAFLAYGECTDAKIGVLEEKNVCVLITETIGSGARFGLPPYILPPPHDSRGTYPTTE